MSRLNLLVRDPISFVGGPWRATAHLVLGRVVSMLYRFPHAQCGVIDIEQTTKISPKASFHE